MHSEEAASRPAKLRLPGSFPPLLQLPISAVGWWSIAVSSCSKGNAVEPDDAESGRNGNAEVVGSPHAADCLLIRTCQDRCWSFVARLHQQIAAGPQSTFVVESGFDDHGAARLFATAVESLNGLQVATEAIICRNRIEWPGHDANAAMAQFQKIFRAQPCPLAVVGSNAGIILDQPVEHDERQTARGLCRVKAVTGNKYDPIDLASGELLQSIGFLCYIVERGHEYDVVAK